MQHRRLLRRRASQLVAQQAAGFLREYGQRLRQAYDHRPFGTIFPFRRVFTVLHRRADR